MSRLDENLLTVTRDTGSEAGVQRMTVVRLDDSSLVFFGAVALEPGEVRALERFGKPAYLIVPSEAHCASAKLLKELYPELQVVAPAAISALLEPVVPGLESSVAFHDPSVSFITVPGTDGTQAALLIETAGGVTLVVDDLFVMDERRVGTWTVKPSARLERESLLPASPVPRTPENRDSLRAQILAWAQISGLNRIIVSHGAVLTDEAPHALLDAAATLAA